jgi:hypothetical protein
MSLFWVEVEHYLKGTQFVLDAKVKILRTFSPLFLYLSEEFTCFLRFGDEGSLLCSPNKT